MKVLSNDEIQQVLGGYVPETKAEVVADRLIWVLMVSGGYFIGSTLYCVVVDIPNYNRGYVRGYGVIGALVADVLWRWPPPQEWKWTPPSIP